MSEIKLTAEKRTEFGKGASRRLRRAHQVPAVLYGHGSDPVHVSLPGHATMLALKKSNQLLTLDMGDGKTELALPKDIQRHPIKRIIEHVDLILVRSGEKVTVDVPIHLVGDAASGTLITNEMNTLSVEVEATHIPTMIELSIAGLEAGARVFAADVPLPVGATLATDPEAVVLAVNSASGDSDTEADADAAADA